MYGGGRGGGVCGGGAGGVLCVPTDPDVIMAIFKKAVWVRDDEHHYPQNGIQFKNQKIPDGEFHAPREPGL